MTPSTEADRLLADQRQRHARYLRYIDREPTFVSGGLFAGPRDPWDASWLDAMPDRSPSEDVERFVRSLADDTLEGDPGSRLDDFTNWVVAADTVALLESLPDSTQRITVKNAVVRMGGEDVPSLRDQHISRPIHLAVHLMRLADHLTMTE